MTRGKVSDEVYAEAMRHFDHHDYVELALVAAFYAMVGRMLDAMGVQLEPEVKNYSARKLPLKTYRYYEFVMAAFVTVLICSNLIGPAKIVQFDWLPFAFGAGVLFFPVSYVFGDILTEVYGYARARRVIWAGFGGLAVRLGDGLGGGGAAAGAVLGEPEGLRDRLRHHLAHRARLDVRLFLRRVRQFVRARQDEDHDRRALAVDAHHRLDHRRRGGGLGAVLPARVLQLRA